MKHRIISSALVLVLALFLFAGNTSAETVQPTEEIKFMGLSFGTKLPEVQEELCSLGFNKTYIYRLDTAALSTRITCNSHQAEMLEVGLPYASVSDAAKYIYLNLTNTAYGNRAYSVGGIDVSRIQLYFSQYKETLTGFTEIKDQQEYWLYAGLYAFDYRGNTAIRDSYKAYTTLQAKLTAIYGEPVIVKGEINVDGQEIIAEHAIWYGENNTGILLKYEPSSSQYSCILIIYGDTSIYELCVDVGEYQRLQTQREGL